MARKRSYWLFKTEPSSYSIEDLERDGNTCWDGVRNYQARNFMRDDMRIGDGVLFYHSGGAEPGVVGLAEVCRNAYPDHTAWDNADPHFDPKSSPEKPVWMMVDVAFIERFRRVLSLKELKARRQLDEMLLVRRGMRLSIQPVESKHFSFIRRLGRSAKLAEDE